MNEINHLILNKGKTFGRDLLLLIDRDYDHKIDYIVFSKIQQEYDICLKSITCNNKNLTLSKVIYLKNFLNLHLSYEE